MHINADTGNNFQLRAGRWEEKKAISQAPDLMLSPPLTDFTACRHRSRPCHRGSDRCHEASVRHLGDNSEHGKPHGEHWGQWDDTGEACFDGHQGPCVFIQVDSAPSAGPRIHQLHTGGAWLSAPAPRERLRQRHQRTSWKGEIH